MQSAECGVQTELSGGFVCKRGRPSMDKMDGMDGMDNEKLSALSLQLSAGHQQLTTDH